MIGPRATLVELTEALDAAGVGVYLFEGPEGRRRWLAGAGQFSDPVDGAAEGPPPAPGAAQRRAPAAGVDETVLRLPDGPGGAPRFCGVMLAQERPSLTGEAGVEWLGQRDGRSGLQAHLTHLSETLPAEADVACCAVGVDGIREFCRAYGYDAGDALIRAVGDRLARLLPTGSACARLAGAKFVVAIVGDDAEAFRRRAEALLAEVRAASFDLGFGPFSVTVSLGAAVAKPAALARPEPFDAALAALDEARGDGEDGMFLASAAPSGLNPAAMRAGAAAVMRAIERDDLAIAYQPVVSAGRTMTIAFRECLARVREEDGSWTPAGLFLPKIERLDLVRALDRRVLRLALSSLAEHPTERLSVNVSSRTMRDQVWLRELRRVAEQSPGVVDRLIVELTESAAVVDAQRTSAFLDEVRSLGAAIALDDFGAGYSSFRLLRDFRPDWVKIDGGFVKGVAEDADNKLFVDTLVGIARNFDMATVAEFVETEEDALTLRALGVDCLQGFRYGRPELQPDWAAAEAVRTAETG